MTLKVSGKAFLVTVAVLSAALLALLALHTPQAGGEIAQEEQRVFLGETQELAVKVDTDDVGHFIGESFVINIVVQYRSDRVALHAKSVESVSLIPLELSEMRVSNEAVDDNVEEYSYEAHVRGIEVVPGNMYKLEPFTLKYDVLSSGETKEVVIDPNLILRFGKYYGESSEGVSLRPSLGLVSDNGFKKTVMFGISSMTSLSLLLFAMFAWSGRREEEDETEDAGPDAEAEVLLILGDLESYRNIRWLQEKPARTRMAELEKIALRLSFLVLDLSPQEFWKNRSSSYWHELLDLLAAGYRKSSPSFANVDAVREAIEIIFTSKPKQKKDRKSSLLDRLRDRKGR